MSEPNQSMRAGNARWRGCLVPLGMSEVPQASTPFDHGTPSFTLYGISYTKILLVRTRIVSAHGSNRANDTY